MPAPEIYRTVEEELILLGGSVLLGIPSGIFCDFLRFFRRIVHHHRIAVFLEDILFFILASFLLLCYISGFGRGEFRMYMVVGMACGFLLHECTLSYCIFSVYDFFARKIYNLWKKIIQLTKK